MAGAPVPAAQPGARLLDVVRIIDTLVSPGGDPWKRQQTHASLAKYLLEEAYEAYDAIEAHDLDALREELGDLLLQVVLHARMAQESDRPWSIDDVATGLVEKMIRRNPHVFEGRQVAGVEEVTANWERIKQEEKARAAGAAGRTVSVLDGVALGQPALALTAKILARARAAGIDVPPPEEQAGTTESDELGEALFALVAGATARGLDPEAALRRAALRRAAAIRAAEAARADSRRETSDPIG